MTKGGLFCINSVFHPLVDSIPLSAHLTGLHDPWAAAKCSQPRTLCVCDENSREPNKIRICPNTNFGHLAHAS